MPVADDAYQTSKAERGILLTEALHLQDPTALSDFAYLVILLHLSTSKMQELQSIGTGDVEKHILRGAWLMDGPIHNIISPTFYLPSHLQLTSANLDTNILYLNMSFECSSICVRRLALYHLEKLSAPSARDYVAHSRSLNFQAASNVCKYLRMARQQNLQTVSVLYISNPGTF